MADTEKTSIDVMHSEWLESFRTHASRYLRGGHGSKRQYGYLFSVDDDILVLGRFALPPGSSSLIDKMALFCQVEMSFCDGTPGLGKIPKQTYWLHSLLLASYPRHKGTFKGHNGAMHCMALREDLNDMGPFVAFQGLGVMIMNGCREVLDPLIPDDELVEQGKSLYLSIK